MINLVKQLTGILACVEQGEVVIHVAPELRDNLIDQTINSLCEKEIIRPVDESKARDELKWLFGFNLKCMEIRDILISPMCESAQDIEQCVKSTRVELSVK